MTGEPYTPYQIWPHHSWLKRVATNLKRIKPGSNPRHRFPSFTIIMGRQDFTTYLSDPPPFSTQDGPEHPVSSPGGFRHWIGSTSAEASGSGSIYYLARQDVAIGAHACLIAGELLHVRFGLSGTRMVNTTSNIQTLGFRTTEKVPPPTTML
jgi:hypothetical protein